MNFLPVLIFAHTKVWWRTCNGIFKQLQRTQVRIAGNSGYNLQVRMCVYTNAHPEARLNPPIRGGIWRTSPLGTFWQFFKSVCKSMMVHAGVGFSIFFFSNIKLKTSKLGLPFPRNLIFKNNNAFPTILYRYYWYRVVWYFYRSVLKETWKFSFYRCTYSYICECGGHIHTARM